MESLNDTIESMPSLFAYKFTPNANPEEFLTNFDPEYNVFDTTYKDSGLNDINSGNHLLKEEDVTSKDEGILKYNAELEISGPLYGVQLTDEEVNTLLYSFTEFIQPQELLNDELSLYGNVIVEPTETLSDSRGEHPENYVLVLAANPVATAIENQFFDPNMLRLKVSEGSNPSPDDQSSRLLLSKSLASNLNAASGEQVLAIFNQSVSRKVLLGNVPQLSSAGMSLESQSSAEDLHCGRFSVNVVPNVEITLEDSLVQCLGVVINYHGYTGTILATEYNASGKLVNHACTLHDCRSVASKAITQIPTKSNEMSEVSGSLQRVRHVRDIQEIYNSVTNIVYYESSVFDSTNPYEPQYFRYEVDEKGTRINESKCGACPYCEELKFLTFKNSSYLSHLTLEHGIYSNNYLIPEGLYYGVYEIKKAEPEALTPESCVEKPRPRHTKAIQCPVCFEVVEVCCWSMKTNPLLSYFRHFKKRHSNLPNTPATAQALFNTNTHVHIKKRGRTLHVKDQ